MFSDASSHARESVQYKTGQYGRSQVIHFAMALLVSWVYSADVKVQCSTVQYSCMDSTRGMVVLYAVRYSTIHFYSVRYFSVWYFSVWYGTVVIYIMVWYRTVKYGAVQYIIVIYPSIYPSLYLTIYLYFR